MKTMNRLTTIATELVERFGNSIDAERHDAITNAIECGEEGIAVSCVLAWAIDENVSIPESYWVELVDFYGPLTTQSAEVTQRLLQQVPHAA